MRPNRHHRRHPLSSGTLGLTAMLVVLAIAAGAGVRYFFHSDDNDSDHRDEIATAQDAVRAKLAGQIYFHAAEETSFEALQNGKVHISGTVDVLPPNGRTISYGYTVIMHLEPDNGWITDDVGLVPL